MHEHIYMGLPESKNNFVRTEVRKSDIQEAEALIASRLESEARGESPTKTPETARERNNASVRKYAHSKKGKATIKARNQRPEVIAVRKARQREYKQRPEVKARNKARQWEYRRKPEVQALSKALRKERAGCRSWTREERNAYHRAYNRRPYAIARRKAHNDKPEVQAKRRAYQKQYATSAQAKANRKAREAQPKTREKLNTYRRNYARRDHVRASRTAYRRKVTAKKKIIKTLTFILKSIIVKKEVYDGT